MTEREHIKNTMRIKQLIYTELVELSELYPKVSITKHLHSIMRPYKESYFWDDKMLLKKIEKYRSELEDLNSDEEFWEHMEG